MDKLISHPRLEDREHLGGEPRLQRMCPEGPGGDTKSPEYRPDDEEGPVHASFLHVHDAPSTTRNRFLGVSCILRSCKALRQAFSRGLRRITEKRNGGMPVVDMPPFRSPDR